MITVRQKTRNKRRSKIKIKHWIIRAVVHVYVYTCTLYRYTCNVYLYCILIIYICILIT